MLFANICIEGGGSLCPLLVPRENVPGPSLSNPTILVNKENDIVVNLRNLNYVLYHSEEGVFEHSWGPLCYFLPLRIFSRVSYFPEGRQSVPV